jgi:uncharacterized membrane protein YgaE (UPF0421/DUF939 family)
LKTARNSYGGEGSKGLVENVGSITSLLGSAAQNLRQEQRKISETNIKLAHSIQAAKAIISTQRQEADFERHLAYSKFSTRFKGQDSTYLDLAPREGSQSHRTKQELPPLRSTFLFTAKELNPSAQTIDFKMNEQLHSTR